MAKVLITGGSKGMGRSMVELFAKNGNEVATCSRNLKDLEDLKKDIFNKYQNRNIYIDTLEATSKEDVQRFGKKVLLEFGCPDILVNNTGIFLTGQIHNEEDGLFEKQMNTNLASSYHLTRVFLNDFMKRRSGYIFNICSIASITAYAGGGTYTMSKFAMLAFSKVLREELMDFNVRVTAVLPGATRTSSWDGTEHPVERFIQPEDIAKLIYDFANSPETMVVEEVIVRPLKGDI
ncbi:MAG: SDR family oxidoreductase [Flavobacteriales bacterium]|nr:SDR family oxidoreductase [Flavobacteriales bacterium]